MEFELSTPVKFTENATAEIKKILISGQKNGDFLRVGVKGGGCSGLTYVLEFDSPEPGDEIYNIDGVPVVIYPAHNMYLFGMEIDFNGGLNSRGFEFKNPNATKTCGCGTSFSV